MFAELRGNGLRQHARRLAEGLVEDHRGISGNVAMRGVARGLRGDAGQIGGSRHALLRRDRRNGAADRSQKLGKKVHVDC